MTARDRDKDRRRALGPDPRMRLLGLATAQRVDQLRSYGAAGTYARRLGHRWFAWSPLAGYPNTIGVKPWVVSTPGAPRVDFA